MRVATYLWVSTDDREQALENQRLPLQDYCRAQGWTEIVEYADEASATDLRGRKARRLLDDAAKRKLDFILVWQLDRMAGSVLDATQTLERLRAWGVGSCSYEEPYLDTTSPFGEALFFITMAYAQLERGILSERTTAGMDRARRQGKHIGRPPVMALSARPAALRGRAPKSHGQGRAAAKARIHVAAQAESMSVSEWIQALAAGHAAKASQAHQNGLWPGERKAKRLEAIRDAASLWSRYGGRLGGTEDCWFDRIATPWAKNLGADDLGYLREFLADKPNLTQAMHRWLDERSIAAWS